MLLVTEAHGSERSVLSQGSSVRPVIKWFMATPVAGVTNPPDDAGSYSCHPFRLSNQVLPEVRSSSEKSSSKRLAIVCSKTVTAEGDIEGGGVRSKRTLPATKPPSKSSGSWYGGSCEQVQVGALSSTSEFQLPDVRTVTIIPPVIVLPPRAPSLAKTKQTSFTDGFGMRATGIVGSTVRQCESNNTPAISQRVFHHLAGVAPCPLTFARNTFSYFTARDATHVEMTTNARELHSSVILALREKFFPKFEGARCYGSTRRLTSFAISKSVGRDSRGIGSR